MRQLWEGSTAAFLLQVIIGAAAYAAMRDVGMAFIVALSVLVLLTISCGIVDLEAHVSTEILLALVVAVLASAGVGVATMLLTASASVYYISTVMILAAWVSVAFIAAEEAQKRGAEEPHFLLFMTTMPFGIGMVFGGAILLHHRLYETNSEPIDD